MSEKKMSAHEVAEEFEWVNVRIESTMLGYEDHGILTAVLQCQGECWSQGFGCRSLTEPAAFQNFVSGVLKALRVERWEQVTGKLARIGKRKGAGHNDNIAAIRPIVDIGPIFIPDDGLDTDGGLYK
jgi:hypothetical protein